MAARSLNLCDGYSGFELALRPLGVRTVCRVERDSYAAAVLVERMAQARLDQAPIWDDLVTFDGAAWRGRVDLITAGFPCQPFSAAGQRLGLDDDRWLWPSIARIIAQVEPRYVILENVPGVVGAGLPEVLADLARLGFDAEWSLLSAADVGAPHRRERFWLVAHAADDGRVSSSHGVAAASAQGDRADVAHRDDAIDAGRSTGRTRPTQGAGPLTVGHAARRGRCEGHGPAAWDGRADRAEAAVAWPPGRDDADGWRQWIAAGGPQPVLRRDTDGPPDGLADALHLGGNGLVPAAAREAVRQLLARAGWCLT